VRAIRLAALACLLLAAGLAQAQPPAESYLDEHLAGFRPFLGKTFRGELKDSTPAQPMVDVSHWEIALAGKAVRNLHSLNDGAYCGETLIFWDSTTQSLIYYYFTSGGFYTQGTMRLEGTTFIAHEKVTGEVEGITEVRATGELLADGTLKTSSEYLKNGEWVPGHGAVYREAPDAKVIGP
jgi:hypothetical protein